MRFDELAPSWDLVIVGGGITGAGILREAVRAGLKTLLVEQRDFAWGTSSRSSKLVHGGLRYLKQGRLLLTRAAVRERQRLMREAPGLVDPMEFYMPVYRHHSPSRSTLAAGLSVYSFLAGEKQHHYFDAYEFRRRVPDINPSGLVGGFEFMDAQVDDARLVLRVIQEARAAGGEALNYARALEIERNARGVVNGLRICDSDSGEPISLRAPAVINATGAFAETLQPSPHKNLHIRPLRGSHLVFPAWALPIPRAVSCVHPRDRRPIFAIPWEEAVLIGTTDVDHDAGLDQNPRITAEETQYLLEGMHALFPGIRLCLDDCISTYAGVRPVLSQGEREASAESREHAVWVDKGLVTITGGKLTTFRRLAWDALKAVKPFLDGKPLTGKGAPVFAAPAAHEPTDGRPRGAIWRRLQGRYGLRASEILQTTPPPELTCVPGTRTLWAELPFAARHEKVRHLSDLLLRRVRIGLLCPAGGKEHLDKIQRICEPALPWDRQRWRDEKRAYLDNWNGFHNIPSTLAANTDDERSGSAAGH